MITATTITGDELEQFLISQGIRPEVIFIADDVYALPDRDWIAGEFAQALAPKLEVLVGPFVPEESDCDDFADVTACFARICHRKTLARPRESSIALGEFWYTRADGGGHAISILVPRVNGQLALAFFEPQWRQLVTLSQPEIASCAYCGL